MPVIRKPELPHIIIGTAGHVDHGKTSLIRFLTGCETDKLREEKERGLSINLGFAPCMLPGNRVVGVVDVPGHIDFIRNMVAGAASIDILLLVIAADDGVMPQTIEHMQIVNLLRTPKVLVALTKTDLVEPDMLELATEDVRDFLVRTGFPDAPIMPVSNVTFEGIPEVLQKLDEFISAVEGEEDRRLFRMNIERTFSVKGMGTVATGIPTAGHITSGETLAVQPLSKTSGIRAIHNYKHQTDQTGASICSAINLRDVEVSELERGMTLCTPDAFTPVDTVLVTLKNITHEYPLKHNTEVKFHSGTAETPATVGLIEGNLLKPGVDTVARIKLDRPLVLVPGDRFVIRKLSPSITYGGGSIMAPGDYRFKRSSDRLRARLLAARDAVEAGDLLGGALLAAKEVIFTHAQLLKATYLVPEAAEELVAEKVKGGFLSELGGNCFVVQDRAEELVPAMVAHLQAYHKANPYSLGMQTSQVGDLFGIPPTAARKLVNVVRALEPEVLYSNDRVSLKSMAPKISSKLIEKKGKLEEALISAGNQGLARGDVKKDLSIVEADMKTLCKILIEEDALVITSNRLLGKEAFETCRQIAMKLYQEDGVIDLGKYRERTGISRNITVTLLEKLDSLGLTKRTEDGRVWIGPTEA